ncbi:MAG: hypothetical protein ABSE48_14610 [Verrucomicrobiota bacterium]|jgi:hypothetical protein
MKTRTVETGHETMPSRKVSVSEILILADGKIFAHNITPAMAGVLSELDPSDEAMNQRARRKTFAT